jgi:hypothetical protein
MVTLVGWLNEIDVVHSFGVFFAHIGFREMDQFKAALNGDLQELEHLLKM